MANMEIREQAEGVFHQMKGDHPTIDKWVERLKLYQFQNYPHEEAVWYTCVLALKAVSEGNYGVGAVILKENEIIAEGYNKLLQPFVRTDQHAEMNALNEFEDKFRNEKERKGFILISSLECCPMCTTRLINSGIREIYYAAEDPDCGMVHLLENMPPFWKRMMSKRTPKQQFLRTKCSKELIEIAGGIFFETEDILSDQVSKF